MRVNGCQGCYLTGCNCVRVGAGIGCLPPAGCGKHGPYTPVCTHSGAKAEAIRRVIEVTYRGKNCHIFFQLQSPSLTVK